MGCLSSQNFSSFRLLKSFEPRPVFVVYVTVICIDFTVSFGILFMRTLSYLLSQLFDKITTYICNCYREKRGNKRDIYSGFQIKFKVSPHKYLTNKNKGFSFVLIFNTFGGVKKINLEFPKLLI